MIAPQYNGRLRGRTAVVTGGGDGIGRGIAQRLASDGARIIIVASFLCSDDASYMTGNTLFVDGGGHINGVAWAPDLGD